MRLVVTEKKSPRGERATDEAIANGFLMENDEKQTNLAVSDEKPSKKPSKKPSNLTENDEGKTQKPSFLTENNFPSMIVKNVYEAIKMNG